MFLHSQSISCDISWARMTVVLPVPHTRRGWYSCLLPGVATVLPGGWQRRRCSPAQPSQQHPQNLLPGGLSPERHRRASVLRHRGACTEEGKGSLSLPFLPPSESGCLLEQEGGGALPRCSPEETTCDDGQHQFLPD